MWDAQGMYRCKKRELGEGEEEFGILDMGLEKSNVNNVYFSEQV